MPKLVLHPAQEKVLNSQSRFICAVSGVQGGKTTIGALWLLKEIQDCWMKGKVGDFLIAAPTAKIIHQSTLPKFREFFPKDWGEWKEARQCFELAKGGTLYVRSTDNPDHLEGMTLLGAWLDEAGQMKERVWINIQGRLAIHMGRCLMTTTPYNMGWFYRDLVKNDKTNGIEVIFWQSSDNPSFKSEELERARRTLPEHEFRRRYNGEFIRPEGLVYNEFEFDKHVIEPFEIPSGWMKFAGLDFGYSAPTAIVCVTENPNTHEFFVYKEYYKSETILSSVANFIQNEGLRYVLADPQGAQQIAELNKFYKCGNVKPADNTVGAGINRINSLLKEERLKFFKGRCQNTLDEIEEYHWKKNAFECSTRDLPEKQNDHCMDALRYAFSRAVPGLYPDVIESKQNLKSKVRQRMNQFLYNVDIYTGY